MFQSYMQLDSAKPVSNWMNKAWYNCDREETISIK